MLDDPNFAERAQRRGRAAAPRRRREDGVRCAGRTLRTSKASAGLIRSTTMTEPRTSSFGQVDVIQATIEEMPVVANLLELYAHDFSEFHSVEPGPDGRFEYPDLPLYWSETGRHPFLVRVDGKLAGFALIRETLPVSGSNSIWDIAEFFVLRAYRRGGVGTESCQGGLAAIPGELAGAGNALESGRTQLLVARHRRVCRKRSIFVQRRKGWREMGRLLLHVDCAALKLAVAASASISVFVCSKALIHKPLANEPDHRVWATAFGVVCIASYACRKTRWRK